MTPTRRSITLDSLTQLSVGAAVGEAVLGPRVGRKAMAWGAFLGTLPDLRMGSEPTYVSSSTVAGAADLGAGSTGREAL